MLTDLPNHALTVLANSTSCTLWQKERKERGKQDDWKKQIHEN